MRNDDDLDLLPDGEVDEKQLRVLKWIRPPVRETAKASRTVGKRSNPDWRQITVHLPIHLHRAAKIRLIQEEAEGKPHRDFSDLCDQLVSAWVIGQRKESVDGPRELRKLALTDAQKEAVEASLGLRGDYSGYFDYVRSRYFPGRQVETKDIRRKHWLLKVHRKQALKKLIKAYEVSPEQRNLLQEMEPWYRGLFDRFPEIEKVVSTIANFRNVSTRNSSGRQSQLIETRFAGVPKDILFVAIASLRQHQQEAELMLGLRGKSGTIKEYAESAGLRYFGAYQRVRYIEDKLRSILVELGITLPTKYRRAFLEPRYIGSLNLYRKEVLSVPEMSESEVRALLPQVLSRDQGAEERLYQASLRYVLPQAYYYRQSPYARRRGLAVHDLIQEGNIGLLRAVRLCRYNPQSDSRWAAYASVAAKYAIKSALAGSTDSHLIRIPIHRQAQVRKYIQAEARLRERLARDPKLEELATEIGVGIETTLDIQNAMRIYCARTLSLDAPAWKSDDPYVPTLAETIPAPHDGHTTEGHIRRLMVTWAKEHIGRILFQILSPLEEYIIRLAFGFDGEDWEDEQIALDADITEKEVRTVKQMALTKLKANPEVAKWLQHLLE